MMDGQAGRWCGCGVVVALLAVSGNAWCADGVKRPRRNVIAADETHGLPPGFHTAQETRWGAIIGGACTAIMGAASINYGLQLRADYGPSNVTPAPSGGEFFIIAGAIVVATGVPIFIYGVVEPREIYVRDKPQNLSLRVAPGPRGVAANLSFNF